MLYPAAGRADNVVDAWPKLIVYTGIYVEYGYRAEKSYTTRRMP